MLTATITVSGMAAADVLRRLANRYAHCTVKGRLLNVRTVNAPWYDERWRKGGYRAWSKHNEEERQSYRDALKSFLGELPDVIGDPLVPATKANGLSFPLYSYDRARKIAAEYEDAVVELATAQPTPWLSGAALDAATNPNGLGSTDWADAVERQKATERPAAK